MRCRFQCPDMLSTMQVCQTPLSDLLRVVQADVKTPPRRALHPNGTLELTTDWRVPVTVHAGVINTVEQLLSRRAAPVKLKDWKVCYAHGPHQVSFS